MSQQRWRESAQPLREGFPGGSIWVGLCGSVIKNLTANAGDVGSIPGSGRSPGEGNGNPLQCSCLENPMDRGAWCDTVRGVTKSRKRPSRCACERWASIEGGQAGLWAEDCEKIRHVQKMKRTGERLWRNSRLAIQKQLACMHACAVASVVSDSATPRTVAHQTPLFMGFSREEYSSVLPFPSPGKSAQPRDRTQVPCTAGSFFTNWATREEKVKLNKIHISFTWDAYTQLLWQKLSTPWENKLHFSLKSNT